MYRMRCESARGYDVRLAQGLLEPANGSLADAIGARRALVVLDPAVDELYGDKLRHYLADLSLPVTLHVTACTEETKSMTTVLEVCAAAQRHGVGRRDLLIAFGGGVCCDIVSVAASLIRRGIPYVCLPTTLVAQVDAGIGLKGAINFGESKNYLGCFAAPELVLVDPSLLRTLSAAELRSGLAEMLKVAIVLDGELYERLREVGSDLVGSGFSEPTQAGESLIVRSALLMLDQLALDCYEICGLERLVDFGHTFSGRLEELSGFRLRHGEAVSIDMALTCSIGVELGLLPHADLASVLETLDRLGLPVHSPLCTPENLMAAMAAVVAHRDGALNLVVPVAIGAATFVRDIEVVTASVLAAAVRRVERWAGTTGGIHRPAGVTV